MTPQLLLDGVLLGSTIGLASIGLTLTYAILGFGNFSHGELLSWGAYLALPIAGLVSGALVAEPLGALSFGWPLVAASLIAMALTGVLAFALDWALFGRLRRRGGVMTPVIASFGASLALRNLIQFVFGPVPAYYSRDLQIAMPFGPFRITPDQIVVLAVTAVLVIGIHLLLSRTHLGRAMRATAENPQLAQIAGIDIAAVVRDVWLIGGALAAAAGVLVGVTIQLSPGMGFDLLLPLFAAVILGGIGSVPGAVLGGLVIGLAEAASGPLIGTEYRSAVAFMVLLLVLVVKPTGLFGGRS
jgi:branched-chain amino acid transport system permease protein